MWSQLMETGSGNLALLHCSCLHACLAEYSNILRRDLNTTCITSNRGVWRHGSGPIRGGLMNTWRLLKQAFMNTSKVTGNRQEDRSSQWEATKKSVGPSTARVVSAHRDRYRRRWTWSRLWRQVYEVVSAQLLAFARLQSIVLWHFQ